MKNACTPLFALVALTACVGLSGCASSPPARFISLAPVAAGSSPVALSGPPIRLGRVHLPSALDQPYLVTATGPNTRDVSNTVRWIAPLDKLVHSTLKKDLEKRLKPEAWSEQPSYTARDQARVLNVTIDSFIAHAGNRIRLDAHWQLAGAGGDAKTAQTGKARIQSDAQGASGGHVAAAMSEALAKLSARIIQQLQTAE